MRLFIHLLGLVHNENAVWTGHGFHRHDVAQLRADVADRDHSLFMGDIRHIGLVSALHLPAGNAVSAGLLAAFAAQQGSRKNAGGQHFPDAFRPVQDVRVRNAPRADALPEVLRHPPVSYDAAECLHAVSYLCLPQARLVSVLSGPVPPGLLTPPARRGTFPVPQPRRRCGRRTQTSNSKT